MISDLNSYFTTTVRFHHPVLDLNAVRAALNVDTEGVIALIEDGQLRWAFNVSATSEKRRTVRVLGHSVVSYQNKIPPPVVTEEAEFLAVCDLIMPGSLARAGIFGTYRACMLAPRLAIDGQSVMNLIQAGELQLAKERDYTFGPEGSPLLTATSIKDFLQRRRIT